MTNFILWCLTHTQTLAALIFVAMLAFVAGAAYQFCEDDKKTRSAGTPQVEERVK